MLVAAFVAAEAQVRQDYFLFCARAGFAAARATRAGRDAVFRGGAAFRAAGRLAVDRAAAAALGVVVRAPAAGRSAAAARLTGAGRLSAAGRASAAGLLTSVVLRCTMVKRV